MQTSTVIESEGQLICQKYQHNSPVILVNMEESVPFRDKFFCLKCLETHRGVTKMTPIKESISVMKEKQFTKATGAQSIRQQSIKKLKEFQDKLQVMRIKVMTHFAEIQSITDQWIITLEQQMKSLDLMVLFSENESKEVDELIQNNKSIHQKIETVIQKVLDINEITTAFDSLKDIIIRPQVLTKQQSKIKIKEVFSQISKVNSVTILQTVKQDEWCSAMAFNNKGTIMVAGCEDDLKVWKFCDGQLSEQKKITGFNEKVYCIVFSKKVNWFASGSQDKTVRCWKEEKNNYWECSKIGWMHTDYVMCLILNNNEDELYSCSCDKTIRVWKVNCQMNLLEYYYTLEERHTNWVHCIALNESESNLVSCSEDKQIILWSNTNDLNSLIKLQQNKYHNNKWIYKNHIKTNDSGMRIAFIDNTHVIWQQQACGTSLIFQIENQQLQIEYKIKLDEEIDDQWLFPTIINEQKQIIIQKHNKYLYLLQQLGTDKRLKNIAQIDCHNQSSFGTLTTNGEYLVIWSRNTRAFRVYQIKYQ